MKFEEFFDSPDKKFSITKGRAYFQAYERHTSRFVDKVPRILEIGIDQGGSIEMWYKRFDGKCEIWGVDIRDKSVALQKEFHKEGMNSVHLIKGDQGSSKFWDEFLADKQFDIVVDDGSHQVTHQILTFEKVFPKIRDGGVYICEDLCTSYWPKWGGGFKKKGTMVEYMKNHVDFLNERDANNKRYGGNAGVPSGFRRVASSVCFYDGLVAIDKIALPPNCAERKDPKG